MWTKLKQVNPVYWVALVVALLCYTCATNARADEKAKESAAALKSAQDSLKAARGNVLAANTAAAAARAKIDTQWIVRTKYIATADVHKDIADNIVKNLVPSDTAEACRAITNAYNERTTECASLRLAAKADSVAIRVGVDSLRSIESKLGKTLTELDHTKEKLRVIQTNNQCKLILFVPCLSRKASFVAGALGGGFLAWRLSK